MYAASVARPGVRKKYIRVGGSIVDSPRSLPLRGLVFPGVLMIEKYKYFRRGAQVFYRVLRNFGEELAGLQQFLKFSPMMVGSMMCSQSFTCGAFCSDKIHNMLSGATFASFLTGEIIVIWSIIWGIWG